MTAFKTFPLLMPFPIVPIFGHNCGITPPIFRSFMPEFILVFHYVAMVSHFSPPYLLHQRSGTSTFTKFHNHFDLAYIYSDCWGATHTNLALVSATNTGSNSFVLVVVSVVVISNGPPSLTQYLAKVGVGR